MFVFMEPDCAIEKNKIANNTEGLEEKQNRNVCLVSLTADIACGDSRDWLASNASSTGTIE